MYRILLVVIIILQCSFLWAVRPLPEGISTETEESAEVEYIPETGFEPGEEAPPPEIQKAIELEKQMKEEVIQRKREEEELEKEEPKEETKKIVDKRALPISKDVPKGPSISVIITALIILLISFFIYRTR